MTNPEPNIRVNVDPTNPGQFFACCGLLELADRLWNEPAGWFVGREFCIAGNGTLADLVQALSTADMVQLDPDDGTSSPIRIGEPFRALRLDWWHDNLAGGRELKVWAGSMESFGIARAMQHAIRSQAFLSPELLDVGMIVRDPENSEKKKEPYYFDARRGPNAHSRDIGFSPNDLQMTTTAFPAVELLCLIGLQRCLPAKTARPRLFQYFTWAKPLTPALLAPAVAGQLTLPGSRGYQFESWYRTGQKKHKAFRSAIPLPKETDQ
jgi:CRISPR-associated protein Csx14